ncbi:MAG: MoxR family ATPase [Proteobacteria bacterium]|nr:MoxR family ATPase [Pseudomonadota bacterium]
MSAAKPVRPAAPAKLGASEAKPSHLAALGVYGFDAVEPVVLAALVTEDPLLLVGNSGTGKTFLLNTLSEALGLEHRHYNASLIAFDDLVGFPYPDAERGGVKFLETPATVWGAESVLIDEISRCKPEHQNRLFSLVHERRIQGIALPKLRFRWAAMNPCSADQGGAEDYAGSEALDPALADRFALFVRAADWAELSAEERMKIAAPAGEGKVADDGGQLRAQIEVWRARFLAEVEHCPEQILVYVTTAVTALNGAGIRISPRRSRLMARSLLAASLAAGGPADRLFRRILDASLPQPCWGVTPGAEAVAAAHRAAWDVAGATAHRWLHAFMVEDRLAHKLGILLDECDSPDSGSQAIAQLLATEAPERAAAFAYAVYPAAALGSLPIGAEGVNDLGKLASPLLAVEGEVSWSERLHEKNTQHPEIARYAQVMAPLKGGRLERARQLFNAFMVQKLVPADPAAVEAAVHACVALLKKRGLA